MSQFVVTHFVQQYTTNVQLLSQQKGSRLRGKVTTAPYVGKAGVPVDQFVATTAQRRTTRYPAITPADTQTDRRWVYPADFDWSDWIDNIDKLRMLIDPQGKYVENARASMMRAIDDEIIAAFFGTAKTGVDGGTSTTFPTTQQVSASEGSTGATGMNVEKLKAGIQILLSNEAWDPESGMRINVAVKAKQNRNLMDEIQIISGDFNNEKPLVAAGMIMQWGPIDFIHSERLAANGSSQDRCPMWVQDGMHLGIWQDFANDISQRKDLAGLPWQVYQYLTVGATRLEEKKVVELPCA
jgi:hypothetical protein